MITWENINKLIVSDETVENYRQLEQFCENLSDQIETDKQMAGEIEKRCVHLLTKETMYDGYFIFLLSFLIKAFPKEVYIELFLEVAESQPEYTPMNKKLFCIR